MSAERVKYYNEELKAFSKGIQDILFAAAIDDDLSVVEFMEMTMKPLFMVAMNEEGNFNEV